MLQLLNEKKELSENCAVTVKELTKKMNDTLASQEERHRVELKKAVDKQTASDKIKKDRWVDLKTKKIKVNRFDLNRTITNRVYRENSY